MRRSHVPPSGMGTVRWTSASEGTSWTSAMAPAPTRLDEHAFDSFTARDEPPALDVQLEHVVDRVHLTHYDVGARNKACLLPARHARTVAIEDLAHDRPIALRERAERKQATARHAALTVRNGVTVRILRWMSDQPVDRLEHPIADVVLEHLGILVHFRPVQPQNLDQEGL